MTQPRRVNVNTKRIAAGGLVAGTCALIGALGGIAEGSAAAKSHAKVHSAVQTTSSTSGTPSGGPGGGPPGGPGGFGPRDGGPSIHSVSVQLNQAGTGYVTVTSDSGTIQSVDTTGDTVTVVEGLSSSPYATTKLSVPSGATIQLDGKTSTLSALAAGDHVVVSSSSDGTTTVFATDSSFSPGQGHGGPGGGWQGGPPSGPSSSTTTTSTSTTS
jgi:hypothetical protein